MGEIISSRILLNNNILYKIKLEEKEVLELKNAIKNINLFSAKLCNIPATIIQRGSNGVTKYFSVPFSLRFRKTKEYGKIFYQKLESAFKIFYVYTIIKNPF